MEVVSFGTLGTSIQTAEIDDNAITYAKLTDVDVWELLETITATASATETTGSLTAKKRYKIVMYDIIGSTALNLLLRMNSDTGNNYAYRQVNGATVTATGSQSNIPLGSTDENNQISAEAIFQGITSATASGSLLGYVNFPSTGLSGMVGRWTGGNATQITTFTILTSTGTFTGTIKVYGRDD